MDKNLVISSGQESSYVVIRRQGTDKNLVIPPGPEPPSQASWDEMIRVADRIQILEGGVVGQTPQGTHILFESSQPEDLASLRACVRFRDEMPAVSCMCLGQQAFVFFQGQKHLATLGFHHGTGFRWQRWDRDGMLLDNQDLLDWLTARGIAEPAQEFARSQRPQEWEEQQRQRWYAAMPPCLAPFEQEMREKTSCRKLVESERLKLELEACYPNPQERSRLLFRWYGHSSSPWYSIHSYEVVPLRLLRQIPLEIQIQALAGVELSTEELEGAARYCVSGYFLRDVGPAWKVLPQPLLHQLLEHTLQTPNRHLFSKHFIPQP